LILPSGGVQLDKRLALCRGTGPAGKASVTKKEFSTTLAAKVPKPQNGGRIEKFASDFYRN